MPLSQPIITPTSSCSSICTRHISCPCASFVNFRCEDRKASEDPAAVSSRSRRIRVDGASGWNPFEDRWESRYSAHYDTIHQRPTGEEMIAGLTGSEPRIPNDPIAFFVVQGERDVPSSIPQIIDLPARTNFKFAKPQEAMKNLPFHINTLTQNDKLTKRHLLPAFQRAPFSINNCTKSASSLKAAACKADSPSESWYQSGAPFSTRLFIDSAEALDRICWMSELPSTTASSSSSSSMISMSWSAIWLLEQKGGAGRCRFVISMPRRK